MQVQVKNMQSSQRILHLAGRAPEDGIVLPPKGTIRVNLTHGNEEAERAGLRETPDVIVRNVRGV